MFETVAPETAAPRSRRLFYETLPVSLAVHALAAGSLLASAVWNIEFPKTSPKMYAAYSLAEPPPPPPPPPPPAAPRPTPLVRPVNEPVVAPTIIPDTIPVVIEPPPVEVAATPVDGAVPGGIEGGEAGGVIGGVAQSVSIAPPPPPPPPAPAILEVARDEPLPMGAISQDFPAYPEYARSRGWQDELVVRYRIGKDGRVKEVSVVKPPGRDEFTRAALSAIRHWRFHPFRDEQGQPKEVVHELTVQFKIARRSTPPPS